MEEGLNNIEEGIDEDLNNQENVDDYDEENGEEDEDQDNNVWCLCQQVLNKILTI